MRLGPVAALAAGVSAAACGYRPGTFAGKRGPFAGERVTVGCLEVAVASHGEVDARGPVLAYEFGNRCDRPSAIDLGAVRVRGRTITGREVELTAYDPRGELRPVQLEARRTGREVIEYRSAVDDTVQLACVDLTWLDGSAADPREVCVDVGPARARRDDLVAREASP